jgi:Spy/CpxP family protein refolding chaperone
MKTKLLIFFVLFAVVCMYTTHLFAQDNRETRRLRNKALDFNMTDEQKQKIEEIKAEYHKTVLPLKNQLEAERLALQSLQKDTDPDEDAIFAKIDEITELQAEIQKKNVSQRLAIRNLLDDDQKALFDARGRHQRQWSRAGGRQRGHMVRSRITRVREMRPRTRVIR